MQRRTQNVLILFALWLMMFSASSQVIIVSPILPEISEALPVPPGLIGGVEAALGGAAGLVGLQVDLGPDAFYGWLISGYALMLCLFALITGPISDKIGRRRILLAGTAAMAGALWLHGIADSFAALLAVRTLAGAAGGMLSGAAVAYVGDYFPYERRGWANGWIMSGMAVGQIIGIPLGKILAYEIGFRWPFLMFAITMTGALLLVWRFVPQPDVELDADRLTLRRAFSNYADLLRQPPIAAAVAAFFLMFLGIGLFIVYLPTWLENEVGLGGRQVALLFAVGGVANVATSPAAGWFSDQVGRKPLIVISCLGLALLMAVTTSWITGMAAAATLYALAMVMVAMRIAPLQSLLTALVPGSRRGILMSLSVGIGQIGIAMGSAAAGFAYAGYGYASNTYIGAVAMVAMAALVHFALPEPDGDAAGVRLAGARPEVAAGEG